MAYELSGKLVIRISSCALFNLDLESDIYKTQGVGPYSQYQRTHKNKALLPGNAFPLIKALLQVNTMIPEQHLVEVVIISRNSSDTGLRAFNAISEHKLGISLAAFSGGALIAPYLKSFKVDLSLSREAADLQDAIDGGVAAAQL